MGGGEAYPDMNKIGKLADILGTNCDCLLRNDVTSDGEKNKSTFYRCSSWYICY